MVQKKMTAVLSLYLQILTLQEFPQIEQPTKSGVINLKVHKKVLMKSR